LAVFLDCPAGPVFPEVVLLVSRALAVLVLGPLAFLALLASGPVASLHGGQGDIIDRSGTHAYGHGGFSGHASNYGYGRSAHGYGDRSWRRRDWARYGEYDVPSNSDYSSCYDADKYSSQLGAYTQIQVCSED
jgi:hypothetical protein